MKYQVVKFWKYACCCGQENPNFTKVGKRRRCIKMTLSVWIGFNLMCLGWNKSATFGHNMKFYFSISEKSWKQKEIWNLDSATSQKQHLKLKIQFNPNHMWGNNVVTGRSVKVINTSFQLKATEKRLSAAAEIVFTLNSCGKTSMRNVNYNASS